MLLRPRWIAGHLLVAVLVALFVALGLWQLRRDDEKHDKDEAARAQYAAAAPSFERLEPPIEPGTRVEATGTYDPAGEVLLRGRVRDGESGFDVLTPLRLDDGTAVLVDRGWLSRAGVERRLEAAAPPTGPVTVRGPIAETRELQPQEAVEQRGGHDVYPRVDIQRVAGSLAYELRPLWITAQYQQPAPTDGQPRLPEPPPSDDVNHMQYALQWFAFAAIGLIGWPVVLSRATRRVGHRESARAER